MGVSHVRWGMCVNRAGLGMNSLDTPCVEGEEKRKAEMEESRCGLLNDSAPARLRWLTNQMPTDKAHFGFKCTGCLSLTGGLLNENDRLVYALTTCISLHLQWWSWSASNRSETVTSRTKQYEDIGFGVSPVPWTWPSSCNTTCQDLTSSTHTIITLD